MKTGENQQNQRELEDRRNVSLFKEEAYERLSELEESLLELEENPDKHELIDSAFRAMHTIKGSGGMFGFEDIVEFTHNIETVYAKVRDGEIPVTNDLIAITLEAHDQIGKMLDDMGNDTTENIEKRKYITSEFDKYIPKTQLFEEEDSLPINEDFSKKELITYQIRFRPQLDLFTNGTNPLLLLGELQTLGVSQITAFVERIPLLSELNPENCYTWWDIVLTTDQGRNAIEDVFIFVDDSCEININILDDNSEYKRIGEILVDRGDIQPEQLQEFLKNQEPLGKKLSHAGLIDPSHIESALAEQNVMKKIKEKQKKIESVSSIRVTSHKLDKLVDLVGELVTAQARLTQIANNRSDPSVLAIAEEVERLTAELRDNTMSVRMLRFGTTFNRFKRLIRDLAAELNAEIMFITEGADTELDKNVIEKLNDPLIHILRNAADHGIESPEDRVAAGKARQGTIQLSASYSGANVLIRINDDGSGLDVARIRQKAIARGLITKDAKLSDKEAYSLIFEPGFSTAQQVTSVSGRGVGMDVVKRAIEDLRGTIDVESKKGKGTTITLKLPLTLAIIDGLLVTVGQEYYVIPLAAVEECIELTTKDIRQTHGRDIADVRGQIVPYVKLRDQFNINGERPEIEQVVITEIDGYRIGFVVDSVIGQHQTVIKNLSRIYKDVESISGATIMADGTVALIIDINKHLQIVEKEYVEHYS